MIAAVTWGVLRGRTSKEPAPIIPGETGPAITVEVLNGSGVDRLARDVTRRLRRRGIDVVYFGSATEKNRDSTSILVRRGDSVAAVAVRNALGTGRISVALDPQRLLDVSIVVGRDAAALDRNP